MTAIINSLIVLIDAYRRLFILVTNWSHKFILYRFEADFPNDNKMPGFHLSVTD